jgi:hypothetical protein
MFVCFLLLTTNRTDSYLSSQTNNSRKKNYFHFVALELAGLRHLFDVIVGNEDYSQHKPSPDAFLTACEKLKVNPEKCWGFEDTYVFLVFKIVIPSVAQIYMC